MTALAFLWHRKFVMMHCAHLLMVTSSEILRILHKSLMGVYICLNEALLQNLLKCAWSPDGHMITCGSSDRYLYVWEVSSRRILYKLPGHQGSVNATDFHPTEPICK